MGYRNRVLDALADAQKALERARESVRDGPTDMDDLWRDLLDASAGVHEAMAELLDSTSPPAPGSLRDG